MKIYKKYYLLFFLISLLHLSCEQPLTDEKMPYVPKLVIEGIIEAGKPVNDIHIARTLPLDENFISAFSNLSDAVAVIFKDGLSYPLTHKSNGIYFNDTLTIETGKQYDLFVQWHNLIASAKTTVPREGEIVSVGLKSIADNESVSTFIEASVVPNHNEAYTASWILLNQSDFIVEEEKKFFSVARAENADIKNQLTVRTGNIRQSALSSNFKKGIKIYIYDSPYFEYFNSYPNRLTDEVFGQTYSNIRWNISGDGIGMFIGRKIVVKSTSY